MYSINFHVNSFYSSKLEASIIYLDFPHDLDCMVRLADPIMNQSHSGDHVIHIEYHSDSHWCVAPVGPVGLLQCGEVVR